MLEVPTLRVTESNTRPVRGEGDFVLYWMIANRRTSWNFALDRALDWAQELGKPLWILEAVRADYRWASARIHRFILDGMGDNADALEDSPIGYYPYVEPEIGAGQGLLKAFAERAAVVVTDDFPSFFLPKMVAAAAQQLPVRLEAVDSNGLLPMAAAGRAFSRAFDFRRHLQRNLLEHVADRPASTPWRDATLPRAESLPKKITSTWPAASPELIDPAGDLTGLPIDQTVAPTGQTGGPRAAAAALGAFVQNRLARYGDDRNQPQLLATSELSSYLHFGHVSSHEVFDRIVSAAGWAPDRLGTNASGKRSGWWNLPASTEAYLDQLVTWRELGYGYCKYQPDYDQWGTLPDWARATLLEHEADPRPSLYEPQQFESAATHDDLWNAAQTELVEDGRIHNYLRMLWGKKVLHWSRRPVEAWELLIELNNKYALDGRNPNSYSGISWVFGRFDRPWGPERPVFGKVRYMTSANTRRKLRVDGYIARHLHPELLSDPA